MPIEDNKQVSDEPRDGNVVIEPPDVGGDDGGDDAPEPQARAVDRTNESGLAPERPAARPSKAGGRSERRKLWEQNEDLRRQVSELTTQLQRMQQNFDQRLEEIRRERTAAPTPAQGGAPTAGPIDAKISTLSAAVQAEISAMRNHDPRNGQYPLERYNQLQDELLEAKQERYLRKWLKGQGVDPDAPRRQAPPQQSQEEIAYMVEQRQRRNIVVSEHPWIAQEGPKGDQYRAALKHAILTKRAIYGKDDIGVDREAAAEVERAFNLTPRRPADPARARRYESVNDGRRPTNGERRSVQVPASMLEGHGLSQEALSRAVFRGAEDE